MKIDKTRVSNRVHFMNTGARLRMFPEKAIFSSRISAVKRMMINTMLTAKSEEYENRFNFSTGPEWAMPFMMYRASSMLSDLKNIQEKITMNKVMAVSKTETTGWLFRILAFFNKLFLPL